MQNREMFPQNLLELLSSSRKFHKVQHFPFFVLLELHKMLRRTEDKCYFWLPFLMKILSKCWLMWFYHQIINLMHSQVFPSTLLSGIDKTSTFCKGGFLCVFIQPNVSHKKGYTLKFFNNWVQDILKKKLW